jgi:hypothetical protein
VALDDLNQGQKKCTVFSSSAAITTRIKIADLEQTVEMRRKALRLFCRAMIRLYLRENGSPDLGNGLGVL